MKDLLSVELKKREKYEWKYSVHLKKPINLNKHEIKAFD